MKQLVAEPRTNALPRPVTAAEVARRAAFAHELPLVEGAITLVASGAAPRVTLVGLNGGLALARFAKLLGDRTHLVVLARQHGPVGPADRPFDLIVERDG